MNEGIERGHGVGFKGGGVFQSVRLKGTHV
jgi:hypothetical protein